jgi:hypothetical protein
VGLFFGHVCVALLRPLGSAFLPKTLAQNKQQNKPKKNKVGPAFFAALERVRAIHDNCRALLRGGHQRAGLELMDQMAGHQERGYEALCRWVQAACRGLGEHDAPEVDPDLAAAVAALRRRPVLFKYCAEEVGVCGVFF